MLSETEPLHDRETSRMELNSLLRYRAEFMIHRSRSNYYFPGSHPSLLLALKLYKNENLSNISCIKDNAGNSFVDPSVISNVFRDFLFQTVQLQYLFLP